MAISECIKRGILKEYLTKQKSEAENMILTEFDQDAYEEMIKDEGRAEGEEKGVLRSLQAVQLLKAGKSVQETAKETGMQEKDVEALAKFL